MVVNDNRFKKTKKIQKRKEASTSKVYRIEKSVDLSVYSNGLSGKKKVQAVDELSSFSELRLGENPNLAWMPNKLLASSNFFKIEGDMKNSQIYTDSIVEERELMLGIDFGTSSVKVVIGDSVLNKAFAVPFYNVLGVTKFLLPSHIYRSDKSFSLFGGEQVHRNLKLSFLENPKCEDCQYRVIAFLSLVIKYSRSWLLQEYASLYKNVRIFWRMAVGLPTNNYQHNDIKAIFDRLCWSAWLAANSNVGMCITNSSISQASKRVNELKMNLLPTSEEDIELSIVPEITAQIYGHVASDNFDKKAANNFLLVDVGAGTVDTCLFHVEQIKGKWDFEFYTFNVESLGTANLNRHRLDWLKSELERKKPFPTGLVNAIAEIREVTDFQNPLPDDIGQYLSNVKLVFASNKANPDYKFFTKILEQIKTKTFWRAWHENHLEQVALKGIPTYLCGGGMRLPYYQNIAKALSNTPNYSWMEMSVRRMNVPKNLIAEGLSAVDYDRLSVAYGLSFLNVGRIVKAVSKPKIQTKEAIEWRSNYVDKDQC